MAEKPEAVEYLEGDYVMVCLRINIRYNINRADRIP